MTTQELKSGEALRFVNQRPNKSVGIKVEILDGCSIRANVPIGQQIETIAGNLPMKAVLTDAHEDLVGY